MPKVYQGGKVKVAIKRGEERFLHEVLVNGRDFFLEQNALSSLFQEQILADDWNLFDENNLETIKLLKQKIKHYLTKAKEAGIDLNRYAVVFSISAHFKLRPPIRWEWKEEVG